MSSHHHHRQSSAFSTASAFRSTSRSPSPSPSPLSPTPADSDQGLSRRHSWNRPRQNTTLQGSDAPLHPLAYTGGGLSSSSGAHLGMYDDPEYDLGLGNRPAQPYTHQYSSQTSLVSTDIGYGQSDLDLPTSRTGNARTSDDQRWLSPGPSTLPYTTPHKKPYDAEGNPRLSSGGRIAGSVARSSTLRAVSRTIRSAGKRVVNLGGKEREDGLSRLPDDDNDIDDDSTDELKRTETVEMVEAPASRPRPEAMPPEGLRGRTLGLFGPKSRVRRTMDGLMRHSLTEPLILLLIIANVVILSIQAADPLNEPRPGNGYFHSWEDYAILALFGVFTFEMLARIIVTGLVLDPEVSARQFWFGQGGLVPAVTAKFSQGTNALQRSMSKTTPNRAAWRDRTASTETLKPRTFAGVTVEAPFQHAVAKQQSLYTAGRPYLRHSWHRIDMLAIVAFWITFLLAITRQEATAAHHIYIFRSLSVLRAGRLLVITSGTSTILHSLKIAGPMLITVAFYVIFTVILFSIIGVQSFRGSFRRSCVLTDPNNSTNEIVLGQICGGHLNASDLTETHYLLEDGSSSGRSPKGFICPLGQVCQEQDGNPEGNSLSFDNIFYSILQVTIIASINTWSDGMYSSMDSDYFGSCLYFIVGVIIINFWMINLVVAVVVNTFKDIRASTKRSAFGAEKTDFRADGQWGTDRKEKGNKVLRLYQKTRWFWVILVFVDLATQACKTADSDEATLSLLHNLELAFTLAFDLEIVIRFVGHLPNWSSFFSTSHQNSFDLLLAVVTTIIQIPPIPNTSVYSWFTIFQLMRWYRVVIVVPRMRPLLLLVFGSFAGLLNLVIFLLLVTLIASLVAVQLFRGDIPEGDTMTFSQTYNSFLGMYQVFSSEDWTTVLFGAMSGSERWRQKWIAAIFLCGWLLFSFFILLQMFIAVINENFAVAEEQKRKEQIDAFIRKSEPESAHVSWIDRLNPYRLMKAHHHSIKVETLPPNLVLPLKQNVGMDVGTGTNMEEALGSTSKSKKAMLRLLGLESAAPPLNYRNFNQRRSARIEDLDDMDDTRGLTDLLPPLNAGPSTDEHMDALRERRNQQADFIAAHPSFDHSLWIFKQSNPIRRFCQACVPPPYGDRIFGQKVKPAFELVMRTFVLGAVIASVAVAAVATPSYRKQYYTENGIHRDTWFNLTEVALGMVLVLEAGIKIVADGFIFAPNAYLLSIWNIMDFAVLVTLLINTTTSLIFIGGLSRVTRALKSFRALRLITLFSRLRDTLHAVLFAGALKILDASVLTILYLVPFAVWGLNIFSGLLYSCNDGAVTGRAECVGYYLASTIDESLTYLVPRIWANPQEIGATHFSFDDFRASLLVLFEIISLEGWIDVMTSAMGIIGRNQQPQSLASQWNSIFFLVFHLLGGCVILALFVSIIIENFSSRSGTALLTAEQRRWVDLQKFMKAQSPSQLPKTRPQGTFRSWCYDRATHKHGYWAKGFTMIYYLHIILLMTEDYSSNIMSDAQADVVFLFLTCLYAFDLITRFYGLGMKSFRANGWNTFDLVVITGSLATTIPALYMTLSGGQPSQVNTQLQKLFLVSIAFKLVQRVSSLNQLFKTSVASLPAIGNLFLLWATLFIFFSILYMEVFGLTKMGGSAFTRFQNYYTFGNSLVMLAFMSTGEGWNGYMHNYKVSYPQCTDDANYFNSDCGSASWAYGLYISWNIISMYIFMNMFTGVVVESFAYVYQRPGGVSVNREEIRAFKKVWSSIDTDRTGYIHRKDFIKFFSRLTGVFELRLYPIEYSISNLIRGSIPDPVLNASGRLVTATGVKTAVDMTQLQQHISNIDYAKVRERRRTFARLYNEARISEEPGKGIGFTAVLLLLAHYKLIEDEEALQLDDLLMRRAKTERVTDLVNFDRVRGFLRTIYWRRKFLAHRDEQRRRLHADGIPAIVLQPTPATPPMDEDEFPFGDESRDLAPSPSPPGSPSSSPDLRPFGLHDGRMSPSLSVTSHARSRQHSHAGSLLSSDDAHHRKSPSLAGSDDQEAVFEQLDSSLWDDMMREAVDQEEGSVEESPGEKR